ncbi:MAG: hypothetical protein R2729_29640 [Bryobacteraceae bacterium]
MRLVSVLLFLALTVPAQDGQRQLLREFDEVTAKATALIEAVDGYERTARQAGVRVHPRISLRRLLLEAAMDDAETQIKGRRWKAAAEKIAEIRGHLAKLAASL